MFKKLIVTGAAAGLLLISASGAFAKNHDPKPTPTPITTVTVTNNGSIENTSVNVANTGLNFVSAPKVDLKKDHNKGKDPKISPITVTTGDAMAVQSTTNAIDTNVVGCGCSTTGISTTTVSNTGMVDNLSVNVANTGANLVSGGSLTTGDATAGQTVMNVINTSVGSSVN